MENSTLENKNKTFTRTFGKELVERLESEIAMLRRENARRNSAVDSGDMELEDCFRSIDAANYGISVAEAKINLLKRGCEAWFTEIMTLDGDLCQSRWCDTRYGARLRVERPDGSVIWTTAETKRGLEKRGLKSVQVKRVAWISDKGYQFPCDFNYWTGEEVEGDNILEMREEGYDENF